MHSSLEKCATSIERFRLRTSHIISSKTALASVFRPRFRLTSLTTSRISLLDDSRHYCSRLHFSRSLFSTQTRRLYSTDDDSSDKQEAALSLINELLPSHHETSRRTPSNQKPQDGAREIVRAEFIPITRQYLLSETPTERWRHRGKLVPKGEYEAQYESTRAQGTSLGPGQEIVFGEKHRAHLEPPFQDIFRKERRLDHVQRAKMRSYVQVLTTPTADTPGTTLLLHFDNKRYLIGSLAEGTQRSCVQMGARLLKVSECFITGRTEWSNTGGIIGMILTLADSAEASYQSSLDEALAGVRRRAKRMGLLDDSEKMKQLEDEARNEAVRNSLTFFGPLNLNHTLATARRFVFRKGMPVHVHEIQEDRPEQRNEERWAPYWADANIKVWAMSITPASSSSGSPEKANGTRSPLGRKRSIDEVEGRGSAVDVANLSPKERDQLTVKAVVSEMFDSSWRLDTLHETPIAQVRLPASLFVRNPETNKIERYHGPLPGGEQPLPDPDLKVLVRKPWPGALVESLPLTEPAKEAISYIIRNHVQRGKFNPEVAKKLKVEEGRKWSQLANGFDVENSEGKTITPHQVLGESKEGGGIAIVDLPGPSYIDNLTSRPEWNEPTVTAGVGAVFWICGEGVASDSRLHTFMKQHSSLQHIVSSPDICPNHIALDSAAASTVRLRKVDPARYSVPFHSPDANNQQILPDGVQVAARGQTVRLEPSFSIDNGSIIPPLSVTEVENEMSPDVLDEAAKAKQVIEANGDQELEWAQNIPDRDAEIITLGTGSALPSKYRNVSATLLRVPNWGSLLFDCGENTLGQLKRVFSPEEFKRVLQELRIISISHLHADHHLGTTSVIKAWYEEVHNSQPGAVRSPDESVDALFEDQKRLAIISEPAMLHWLREYSEIEDFGFSRIAPLNITKISGRYQPNSELRWFVPKSEFTGLAPSEHHEKHARNFVSPSLLGLKDIQSVAVQHCHGARAVAITWPSGFKASYSGDCRPSKWFAQIGKGSTVCIHEATFDDELQGDAEAKNHSTTSEALSVAQAMGAKTCILTHFSQRYQKLPIFESATGNDEDSTDLSNQLPDTDGLEGEDGHDPTNADDATGPLEDAAATFPDQETSNGAGQQYQLPAKRGLDIAKGGDMTSGLAAVKFKLASDMKVGMAFDYMRVKVGEIGQLEKFTPALLKLFAEEDKDDKTHSAPPSGESKKEKKKKKVAAAVS